MPEMSTLINLVTPLLTAFLAAYVAIHVCGLQTRHQLKLEHERRQISNLERLHETLSECQSIANMLAVQWMFPVDQEEIKKKMPSLDEVTRRLEMMINYYASDLAPEGAIIGQELKQLNFARWKIRAGKTMSKDEAGQLVVSTQASIDRITEASYAAKAKLVELIRPYSGGDRQKVWRRISTWIHDWLRRPY